MNRCGEFMGYVGEQPPALLLVGLQLVSSNGQTLGHPIEPGPQPPDLISTTFTDPGFEVTVGDPFHEGFQRLDSPGEMSKQKRPRGSRDEDRDGYEEENMRPAARKPDRKPRSRSSPC